MPNSVEREPTTAGAAGTDQPLRLSPLHTEHQRLGARFTSRAGWLVPQVYTSLEDESGAMRERVAVLDLSPLGKLLLRGDAAADLLAETLGVGTIGVGQAAQLTIDDQPSPGWDRTYLARLAADEFLLIIAPGAEQAVVRRLEPSRVAADLFLTLVNKTSGLAGLAVLGPQAWGVLSKLCALPLAPRDFPNHRVAQSGLAKVQTVIVRNDLGALPALELYLERAYAAYVWEAVVDAGGEVGIAPAGWECLGNVAE